MNNNAIPLKEPKKRSSFIDMIEQAPPSAFRNCYRTPERNPCYNPFSEKKPAPFTYYHSTRRASANFGHKSSLVFRRDHRNGSQIIDPAHQRELQLHCAKLGSKFLLPTENCDMRSNYSGAITKEPHEVFYSKMHRGNQNSEFGRRLSLMSIPKDSFRLDPPSSPMGQSQMSACFNPEYIRKVAESTPPPVAPEHRQVSPFNPSQEYEDTKLKFEIEPSDTLRNVKPMLSIPEIDEEKPLHMPKKKKPKKKAKNQKRKSTKKSLKPSASKKINEWLITLKKDSKRVYDCFISDQKSSCKLEESLEEPVEEKKIHKLPKIEISDLKEETPSLNEVSEELNKQNEEDLKPKEASNEDSKNDLTEISENATKKLTEKITSKKSTKASQQKVQVRKSSGTVFETEKNNRRCVDCGKYFSSQGLGGHRAKAHKGKNPGYRDKILIRKKNEDKRILLRLAQYYYYKKYSNIHIHPKDINRSVLMKLKNEIHEDEHLKHSLLEDDYTDFLKLKKANHRNSEKNSDSC